MPQGSKIHFGKSARLKREIEDKAVAIFYENGFSEISTPSFTFTDDERILSKRKIIRTSIDNNKQMILRNDNTIDVIKIINRHLKISNKKWFYIQPAFLYPSTQINQIGAECIGKGAENVANILSVAVSIFLGLGLQPILQIANMKIPKLCALESGLGLEVFSQMQVQKILDSHSYLREMLYIQSKDSLESYIPKAPNFIKGELQELLNSVSFCEYENMIFSPLYCPKMGYYESLFFRAFSDNKVFLRGGKYTIDGVYSCGFAIYTNEVVDFML